MRKSNPPRPPFNYQNYTEDKRMSEEWYSGIADDIEKWLEYERPANASDIDVALAFAHLASSQIVKPHEIHGAILNEDEAREFVESKLQEIVTHREGRELGEI